MMTLQRHARYELPDGTPVMARCWETGIAPPEWRLHAVDDRSTPLYRVDGHCLYRIVWDTETSDYTNVFCDMVLEDLRPLG